jgi:hypothetical protein
MKGKLLTAEQSVRLAIIDATDRETLIASIVAGLRNTVTRADGNPGDACPFDFYKRPVVYPLGSESALTG